MKSPVRFMARGLAEDGDDEKTCERRTLTATASGGECDGSGGGGRSGRGGSRQAPALRPAIIQ